MTDNITLAFRHAFAARADERQRIVATIVRHATAFDIVLAAVHEYRAAGNDERLGLAAAIIDQHYRSAVPDVLDVLAARGWPEARAFVGLADRLAPGPRARALGRLAGSRHPDTAAAVRSRLTAY